MRFRALGPVAIETVDGLQVLNGRSGRIMATLVADMGDLVSTDRLIDAVWGEHPPKSARNALQVHMSQLRSLIQTADSEPIRTHGSAYVLKVAPQDLDIQLFQHAIAEARREADPTLRSTSLREALSWWRGRPFEPWDSEPDLQPLAIRLTELRLEAEEMVGEAELEAGRHREAIDELRSLTIAEPLRERRWESLMLALYRNGRQAEALRAFQEVRRHLGSELGIDPGPALVALEDRILMQDPSLDFEDDSIAKVINLAPPLGDLIGREGLLGEVLDLLANKRRLVTLHGPGGIGKTRLAIAAGLHDEVLTRFDEIAFVNLESIEFGAEEATVRTLTGGQDIDAVSDLAYGRSLLLILDNCEHVIDEVRTLVTEVLAGTSATILTTTRLPLGITGEVRVTVGPLTEAGAELFTSRAIEAGYTLPADRDETIRAIVAALDGIPLAIELAAARLSVLSIDELALHLDSPGVLQSNTASGRHSTVEQAIRWSYDLLADNERRAFAWLGSFRAGFTASAAEALLGAISEEPLHVLSKLHDAAMVVREPTRLRLLEPVRQFAETRLADVGEEADALDHLADWLLRFVADRIPLLATTTNRSAVDELDAERANIERTLGHLAGTHPARFVKLVDRLAVYWWRNGALDTGDHWSALAIEHQEAPARLLRYAAMFMSRVRPEADASPILERLSATGSASDLETAQAHLEWSHGDMVAARDAFERAAVAQRGTYDPELIDTLLTLSRMRLADGDAEGASELAGQIETMGRAAERADAEPLAAHVRGLTATFIDGLAAGVSHFEKAREGFERLGLDRHLVGALRALALATAARGDWDDASTLARDSLERARTIGDSSAVMFARMVLGLIAAEKTDTEVSMSLLDRALRQAVTERDEQGQAWCLYSLAVLAVHSGDPIRSATLLGASDRIVSHWTHGVPSRTWRVDEPLDQVLREKVGSAFDSAYEAGAELDAGTAIETALGYSVDWVTERR